MSLYKKLIDEAIPHSPLEAELCRQIDKLNSKVDTQHHPNAFNDHDKASSDIKKTYIIQ